MLVDRKQSTYVDPHAGRVKLETFWTEKYEPWLRSTKRPATISQYVRLYESYIGPRFGAQSLAILNAGVIADWLVEVERAAGSEDGGAPTALAAFRVLRAMLGRAVSYRFLVVNPAADVKAEDRPRAEEPDDGEDLKAFTAEELAEIIDAMPERYRGLIALLALGGPRISEAAALRVRNVDLLHGKVRIERALVEVEGRLEEGPPKSGKPRTIDISPAIAEVLKAHMGEPDAFVFSGPEGGPLRRSTFSARVWRPTLRRLGLEHRGIHSLRHTYASLALQAGVPLTVVQRQLGHKKLEITANIYSHLLRGAGEDAALKVGEAFERVQGSASSHRGAGG